MIAEELRLRGRSHARAEQMEALKEPAVAQAERGSTTVPMIDHAQRWGTVLAEAAGAM